MKDNHTPHREPRKRCLERQDKQNTLTVGAVAGVLGGFILSMAVGAFQIGEIKEVPAWLQGISGMVATLISVYAVYLVAQTLKATRETLDATRKMAEDQNIIGNAQTRPWVIIDRFTEEITRDEFIAVHLKFTCYGPTPAKYLDIQSELTGRRPKSSDDSEIVYQHSYDSAFKIYLAPNGSISVTISIPISDLDENLNNTLAIMWGYGQYNQDLYESDLALFSVKKSVFKWNVTADG
ncbi:hypothetical protein H4P12_03545 [Paracoccus sp. 11-3]|uniref:Uncharacterized protein n=1 Tax=Paracoccus amoyensis TaxID=2760093 RepID=A0A926GB49_9RHOB|nr:hypothetical protein [Paracoccus amoyensis]MBC9245805.1 hypothetical protein [Paracoccus amoyensis]